MNKKKELSSSYLCNSITINTISKTIKIIAHGAIKTNCNNFSFFSGMERHCSFLLYSCIPKDVLKK